MHGNLATSRPVLERIAFKTSRLLDFASRKELTAQTGHEPEYWPLVILKELVDNSLDACEEAGIAPDIRVQVDNDAITVVDNGPGLPTKTVEGALDFSIRVSSRDAYVSPTRGAQGNALKTVFTIPFVIDGERGRVEIDACGVRHDVEFRVDRIRQEPVINHAKAQSSVKSGTRIRVLWPDLASSMDNGIAWLFLQIADHYAWLNPHMTLRVDVFGQRSEFTATDQSWVKWKPSDPTSPHWYTVDHLERLVAAHISHNTDLGQDTNAREFVGTFRGLSASAKQKAVLEAAGLTRARLSDLVTDGTTDRGAIARLLDAMKTESRPVEPRLLGLLGEHHFRTRFEAIGCEMDSFAYRKAMGVDDDVPWILEAAFGYLHKPRESHDGRVLVSGVNWSPSIINPFRSLGKYRTFDGLLNQQYVRPNERVMVAIHLACARVEYLDRGKSTLVLS